MKRIEYLEKQLIKQEGLRENLANKVAVKDLRIQKIHSELQVLYANNLRK